MNASGFTLRRYAPADETASIEVWRRSWQAAYPRLDFASRLAWWRERWRAQIVPDTIITVAERDGLHDDSFGTIVGFVTVDPMSGYLDQLVVTPERWGSTLGVALLDEAKRCAPAGLDLLVNQDNARAIRFYGKHGFVVSGADVNAISGAPLHKMSWRP